VYVFVSEFVLEFVLEFAYVFVNALFLEVMK
jgi:hypothetical protein